MRRVSWCFLPPSTTPQSKNLRRNKPPFVLSPPFIEEIHDKLVSISFPGGEPVGKFRDRALLESACFRPFQTAFGQDIFPTLCDKAAALFHALIADHPFSNGCKRTAIIAADLFLLANWQFLFLSKDEAYDMAKCTAVANQNGSTTEEIVSWLSRRFSRRTIAVRSMLRSPFFAMGCIAAFFTITLRIDKLNRDQSRWRP